MAAPVIALLTDFGLHDTYVGELKGAILTVNPVVIIVDITHDVPPQDIQAGAYLLANAAPAFPAGTVYVAVVDPGVGSDRRPILVETPQGAFIGPDNGLFTRIIWPDADDTPSTPTLAPLPPTVRAWHLTNPAYRRAHVTNTFHGRDIFAPAAAYYAAGVPASQLGDPATSLWRLSFPLPKLEAGAVTGEVIHVDHYGNLVTNIHASMLPPVATVEIATHRIEGLSAHYDTTRPLVAIVGSQDTLEIAKPEGSAAQALGIGRGELVRVTSSRSP
ncbi:MAG: SAM-dependent chlorinase/fluorinase [Chloroflexi bacterium]|nr:SAM-dependent chlorinase/fluorinase [Chloroflexota bacterium]